MLGVYYVRMPIHSTCNFWDFSKRYGLGVCPMLNYDLYVVTENWIMNPFNGKIVNLQNWLINKFSSRMKNWLCVT